MSAHQNTPSATPSAPDHRATDLGFLREAISLANIPTLVVVLAQLSGDDTWLRPPYLPSRARGIDDNDSGGLPVEVQDEIRRSALDVITRAVVDGQLPIASGADLDPDRLVELLGAAMGGDAIPPEYGPMIASTLAPDRSRPHGRDWSGRRAIIIGAGISGLCAAMQLDRLGLPYVLVDRQDEVGGSWFVNHYPGAGVDVPSHLYEFTSLPNDWGHYFANRDEVHAYLREVAERCDLAGRVRLGTSVESMGFDEASKTWEVRTTSATGSEILTADFVISAVGAFNQPSAPDLPGLDVFTGEVFHTTQWPSTSVAGKRVVVLGNGASAMQVVPAIAPHVEHLTVVQRSPHWISPFPKLHQPIPSPLRHLMELVPAYRAWYKMRLSWTYMDKLHPVLQRDPAWPHPERSVNAKNDAQRAYFTSYIEQQLSGRPDLIEQVVPHYPPYGKRLLMDNGWYTALKRDNVTLETARESRLTADSLLVNGREHPAGVVVLATGFRVVRFLSTLKVTGRGGTTLDDVWGEDDSRAYLGLSVPDFPNLFILYGPNVQPGHGGSLVLTVEAQMDYLATLLGEANDRGFDTIEVRREAHDRYVEHVDAAHEQMIWTHPGMDTYYRNSAGRVVVSNPYRIVDFWEQTRRVSWQDWSLTGRPSDVLAASGSVGR